MVALSAKLIRTDVLTRSMDRRTRVLREAEQSARKSAARVATTATRDSYRYLRPSKVPTRDKRPSTQGHFTSALTWVARGGKDGQVAFDMAKATRIAPYWIIMEIGTGESATLRRGSDPDATGHSVPAVAAVKTVKSQHGRYVPGTLAFSTGPGGYAWLPSRLIHNQQLYLRSALRRSSRPLPGFYIHNEIKGQRFVWKGGNTAFREYQTTVLAAARLAFDGKGRRS